MQYDATFSTSPHDERIAQIARRISGPDGMPRPSPKNEEAQQVETQQPLSAALFTCSSVVSTSTP